MDFNAGTGTTAHAVVAVNSDDGGNRKYINVEIDEWFDTIMLPRIKRVIFNTPNKSGNVGHSHVMKYYHLEQYEDTLKKVHYKDAEFLLVDERKSPFEQYVFLRDMKMADALEMEGNEIKVNVNRIYPNIDLAETLSCLFGQKIEKLEKSKVTFENGLVVDLENMDYHYIKPLIWWC